MCFLSNVPLTNLDLEGVADKREPRALKKSRFFGKSPVFSWKWPLNHTVKIFSVLRKAFIWWSYRIIKHANMFEAFIRVATKRTPNASHQRFTTAHMTISGQTTKQAIQPKNIKQSVRRGMPSVLATQPKNERTNTRNTKRELPKIQNYKKNV